MSIRQLAARLDKVEKRNNGAVDIIFHMDGEAPRAPLPGASDVIRVCLGVVTTREEVAIDGPAAVIDTNAPRKLVVDMPEPPPAPEPKLDTPTKLGGFF